MGGFKQESGEMAGRALMLENTTGGFVAPVVPEERDPEPQRESEERKSPDQRFSDLHVSMNHQRLLSKSILTQKD